MSDTDKLALYQTDADVTAWVERRMYDGTGGDCAFDEHCTDRQALCAVTRLVTEAVHDSGRWVCEFGGGWAVKRMMRTGGQRGWINYLNHGAYNNEAGQVFASPDHALIAALKDMLTPAV